MIVDNNYSEDVLKKISGMKWIEVESLYLTNQPMIFSGKKKIPDPDFKPNMAYIFCWIAKRTKRGITRKRILKVIKTNEENFIDAVEDFCRQYVIINPPRNPNSYHNEPNIF